MPVVYDVALSSANRYFAARLAERCSLFDLSFFFAEPIWVWDLIGKIQEGEVRIRALIDMASDAFEPDNLYFQLAKTVKATGGYVLDDPDVGAEAAHKARLHVKLAAQGIGVPDSVIVPRAEVETFRITDDLKARLGVPFVVKPGWGGGGLGVNINASGEADLLRCAEAAPYSDSFMLQKRVTPRQIENHRGWFRVFYAFGEVIPCWWEPPANQYQLLTPLQQKLYKLGPLNKVSRGIARVAGMNFFSSEICLTTEGKFLAIDYLNTDCDMSPKSFYPTGVPDEVVRHIASLMVNHAIKRVRNGHGYFDDLLAARDLDWSERRKQGRLVPGE